MWDQGQDRRWNMVQAQYSSMDEKLTLRVNHQIPITLKAILDAITRILNAVWILETSYKTGVQMLRYA